MESMTTLVEGGTNEGGARGVDMAGAGTATFSVRGSPSPPMTTATTTLEDDFVHCHDDNESVSVADTSPPSWLSDTTIPLSVDSVGESSAFFILV